MLIDWFTVGAQLLNFLVLIGLMQRFLYRPVLAAIDAREQKVAASLADAEAKKIDAQRERDDLDAMTKAFDQQREALWAKAGADAETERRRLLDVATHAAATATAKRRDDLQGEAAALKQMVGLRAQQEVFAIVRRTLADLADATLEDRVCAVFVGRLRALDGAARESLAAAIRAEAGPVRVHSAFDLPAPARAEIQRAANESLSADVPLQFDIAPDLIAGIELTVGGQRLEWSIAAQVEAMSEQVAEWAKPAQAGVAAQAEVEADGKPEAKADAKPEPEIDVQPEDDRLAKPGDRSDVIPVATRVAGDDADETARPLEPPQPVPA